MAAATIVAGSEYWGKKGTLDVYGFRTTTAANGEDGVQVNIPMTKVLNAQVTGFATGGAGPFSAFLVSGVQYTIEATAGTPGDAVVVCCEFTGYK